jgi:adenylate cyclase
MWLMQIPALTTAADRQRVDRNPAATPERMLREMGDLLEALTATSPLVLMLEDLHWSDVSTLDLISYLARRRRAAHLMVIGTDRPADLIGTRHPLKGLKQELLARRQCEELALDYLSQESVGHYLAERFPANEFAADVGALIHRRTSGNPLFMVSTVDHLLANGTIERRAGTWALTVPIDTLTSVVPDSVRQLVDALADRLNTQDRETLEAASVAGMEFSTAAVAAALGDDEAAVERRSEDLSRRHVLIRELGVETLPDEKPVGRFGFTHAVYRDALYERLPTTRRMQWHRRVAERGEAVYGTRAREFAAELAMHFEHAGDWPRAAHYLQHAAVNATRRGAYRDAVALARRGLDLLVRVPDSDARAREELRLQVSLGAPLMAIDGYAAATVGVVYGEARRLCDRVSDAPERSHVLWGLWTHHALRAELSTALTLAGELLAVADRAPARDVAMRGHWAMEITSTHQGNFRLALQHFAQALALYESDDHSQAQVVDPLDAGVAVRCFAAWCWWFRGRPDTALRNIHDAIAHARDISDTHGLAHALAFAAVLHQLRGERELAQQQVLAVAELTEQHGLAFYGAMAQIVGGWARVTANGEAIAQMRAGLESWESTGARLMRPYFLTLIADASDARGDDPALALLADAVRVAESSGERWYEAEAYRLRGDRLLKQPRTHSTLEAAETCYRRSLEIARRQEALALELRAAVSLARLPARYDRASRLGAVRDAYERFDEGFDTIDLRAARRVLEQADR